MRTLLQDMRDLFSGPDFIAVGVICLVLAGADEPWPPGAAAGPGPRPPAGIYMLWHAPPVWGTLEAIHEELDGSL